MPGPDAAARNRKTGLSSKRAVLLRLVEPRGPKPPPAEARNSRCYGPRRLCPLELRTNSAIPHGIAVLGKNCRGRRLGHVHLSRAERHRRSDSGAAGRLHGAENWAVLWAGIVLWVRKPITVFAPRWAEYGTEIWAVSWVLLWAELLRLFEPRSSPPPRAVGCNSRKLDCAPGGELL